ncbi:MAG: ATP-binding protein [Sphaerochaetaceae bacterium]
MQTVYQVRQGDFANAGKISSTVKGVLKQLNLAPEHIKRIVVALYEAEVNVVAHSYGGFIQCTFASDKITIYVHDEGPGIPDVTLAMTEGYSTASAEVREMGFGAGMGLSNMRKNCDLMHIESAQDKPTDITMVFNLQQGTQHG